MQTILLMEMAKSYMNAQVTYGTFAHSYLAQAQLVPLDIQGKLV